MGIFNTQVGANIIQMYPATSLFVALGQAAIVVLVLFSYALQVQPCRSCLDKVFSHHGIKQVDPDDLVDDEAPREMSTVKHAILTALIVGGGYTTAYFVSDLQVGRYLHRLCPVIDSYFISTLVCWLHRLNNDFIHPSGIILLEALCGS